MRKHEDLRRYFRVEEYEGVLDCFYRLTAEESVWYTAHPAVTPRPSSQDGYLQMVASPVSFFEALLHIFRLRPRCSLCGKDSWAYTEHMRTWDHFKVYRGRLEDTSGRGRAWEEHRFLLGEIRFCAISGELLVRREPLRVGLDVGSVTELPCEDAWFCVGTEMTVHVQAPAEAAHWSAAFPGLKDGYRFWKERMHATVDRLHRLLAAHNVLFLRCQICSSCEKEPTHLTSRAHWNKLWGLSSRQVSVCCPESLRFQDWDFAGGRLRFDHVGGSIHLVRCSGDSKLRGVDMPVVTSDVTGPHGPDEEQQGESRPRDGEAASEDSPASPPQSSVSAEVRARLQVVAQLVYGSQPRTLYREYIDRSWWWDLVTGEAVHVLPATPHLVLRSSRDSTEGG